MLLSLFYFWCTGATFLLCYSPLDTNLYTLDYVNANVISKNNSQYRPSSYTAPSKGQLIAAGLTNTTDGKLITVNVNGKFITYVQGSYYSRTPLILTLNKGDVVSFEYEDTNVSFYSFVFVPYTNLFNNE